MDTSSLNREYRKYVPLLLEVIAEECGPLRRDDRLIPYEEVVAELEADTVSVSTHIGFNGGSGRYSCGIYSNNVYLMLQVMQILSHFYNMK